ncbi:MAG TPA: peptidyl-prolyl cis-trans isomerase [Bryobacteraceae bacterium]|nr:peptidyl-prolyl cis-trans isomerase [Bryobacteraceae bacterium]
MRSATRCAICLLAALALGAQEQTPPDATVATIDGKKLSAADIKNLLVTLTPQARINIGKNPKNFLQFYFLSRYLGSLAEQAHLDQQSPYKEDLDSARLKILYDAEQAAYSSRISISPEEVKRFYEANRSRYPDEAQIRVITLFYSSDPLGKDSGSKTRTEAEAKALAGSIHQKLTAGGDFDRLQKQYSQDPTSDRGTIRATDKFNETLKKAIFSMKPGQTSEPIQESGAFYIVKVDEIGPPSLAEVREILIEQLKQQRFSEWINQLKVRFTPVMDDAATGAASVDGKKLSAADVKAIVESLPPQLQLKAKGDLKNFLAEYFLVHHIASLAEKAHLDEQSPYKEELAQLRLQILFNAELTTQGNQVPVAYSEEEARYHSHPQDFTEAAVHVLMIFYSTAPSPPAIAGHKLLSEAQAKQTAEKIRAELREDTDFAKLQKQYPNDTQTSTSTLRRDSRQYSQELKDRIFSLHPGEISEPIREPNAFYIVKLDSLTTLPFDKVRDEIYRQFKQERFNAWFQSLQKRFIVTIDNPGFFQQAAQ